MLTQAHDLVGEIFHDYPEGKAFTIIAVDLNPTVLDPHVVAVPDGADPNDPDAIAQGFPMTAVQGLLFPLPEEGWAELIDD